MRFRFILAALMLLWLPARSPAGSPPVIEAKVMKLEGTIMVERLKETQDPNDPESQPKPDGEKAMVVLMTGSTVERGDTIIVYDKSWVLLKSPKGDLIGLEGLTTVTFDELYKSGPTRQIRIILKKGKVLARAKGSRSRQSYFEITTGLVTASMKKVKMAMAWDPVKSSATIEYYGGKMTAIDPTGERDFLVSDTMREWVKGEPTQEDPEPLNETQALNFKRFFDGKPKYDGR